MRNPTLQNWLPKLASIFTVLVGLILGMLPSPVQANEIASVEEIAKLASLGSADGVNTVLAAHPLIGVVGQSRTVLLNQVVSLCGFFGFALDTSAIGTNNLVVLRKIPRVGAICPSGPPIRVLVRVESVVVPTKVGLLTIRDENTGAEITIQTLPASVSSKFDTNGMWFDAATNGSGIALHHKRGTTDVAFGTWFLYSNNGESRWVSLQSANWQQDGSVLEGLLIETRGGCQITSLAACPAVGSFRTDPPQDLFSVTPSRARIAFQSATRARAEVLSLGGKVLFTSELTKLQF